MNIETNDSIGGDELYKEVIMAPWTISLTLVLMTKRALSVLLLPPPIILILRGMWPPLRNFDIFNRTKDPKFVRRDSIS